MACGYSILLLSIPVTPLIQLPTDLTSLLSPVAMPTNWTRVEFKGEFPHSVELVGGWSLDDLARAKHASEILRCLKSSDDHKKTHGLGCQCLKFKASVSEQHGEAAWEGPNELKWVCPTCRAMVQQQWRRGHLKTHINKASEAEATSLLTEALGSSQKKPRAQNSNPLPISCHPAKLVHQGPPTSPSVPSPAQPSQPLRTVPPPVHIPEVTVSPSPSSPDPRSLSWVTRHPPSPIQQSHSLKDSEPPYERLLGIPSKGLHSYQYDPSFA